MRRRLATRIVCALALTLAGCAGNTSSSTGDDSTQTQGDTESTAGEYTEGEWVASSYTPTPVLDAEQRQEAERLGLDGKTDDMGRAYHPVALLTRSTDDASNTDMLGYLCQTLEGDKYAWAVVAIELDEMDEDGDILKNVSTIDPDDPLTSETWEGVPQDWEVAPMPEGTDTGIPEEALAAYRAVSKGDDDGDGREVVLANVATQVVSGTSYLFVVEEMPRDALAPQFLFKVVFEDLDGNCSLTLDSYVNLAGYLP